MKLSVVTAMYKSESFVRPFHAAMSAIAGALTEDYEIIFVDDRSPDPSARVVEELIEEDKRVRLIQLSRNFGQSIAMLAGMRAAKGDYVYTSDIDLEDPPELLRDFYGRMQKEPRTASVYGYMSERKGGFLERWLGRLFYALLNLLSHEKIPHQVWARLMNRKFVDAVLEYSEYHLFWSAIFHKVGFQQEPVAVERTKTGKTSYNYFKKLELALNAITSFSVAPLNFIFIVGFVVSLLSVAGMGLLFAEYLRGGLIPGWASIVCSILFMGGLTNLSIGLIGVYIGRIFVQVKQRPRFIVDRELGGG